MSNADGPLDQWEAYARMASEYPDVEHPEIETTNEAADPDDPEAHREEPSRTDDAQSQSAEPERELDWITVAQLFYHQKREGKPYGYGQLRHKVELQKGSPLFLWPNLSPRGPESPDCWVRCPPPRPVDHKVQTIVGYSGFNEIMGRREPPAQDEAPKQLPKPDPQGRRVLTGVRRITTRSMRRCGRGLITEDITLEKGTQLWLEPGTREGGTRAPDAILKWSEGTLPATADESAGVDPLGELMGQAPAHQATDTATSAEDIPKGGWGTGAGGAGTRREHEQHEQHEQHESAKGTQERKPATREPAHMEGNPMSRDGKAGETGKAETAGAGDPSADDEFSDIIEW